MSEKHGWKCRKVALNNNDKKENGAARGESKEGTQQVEQLKKARCKPTKH